MTLVDRITETNQTRHRVVVLAGDHESTGRSRATLPFACIRGSRLSVGLRRLTLTVSALIRCRLNVSEECWIERSPFFGTQLSSRTARCPRRGVVHRRRAPDPSTPGNAPCEDSVVCGGR